MADYFGVAFLEQLHGVAADLGEAAELALRAGVDIASPTGNAYHAAGAPPRLDCLEKPTRLPDTPSPRTAPTHTSNQPSNCAPHVGQDL